MTSKLTLALLVTVVAVAAGNPSLGVPWRYTPRHPTVSPRPPSSLFPNRNQVSHAYGEGSTRIVGGADVTTNDYPWQVAIYIDGSYFCGGSIINEYWVLTAAHCLYGSQYVFVTAGSHNLALATETSITLFSSTLLVHERYNPRTLKNDVALVKLTVPMPVSAEIGVATLPKSNDPELPSGETVRPTGWGMTSDSSSMSDTLRWVDINTMTNAKCAETYGEAVANDGVICTDSSDGKGICSGDSGGPMNHKEGDKWVVRGIVSFGSTAGCESGDPNGFTNVEYFLSWIQEKTGIQF